MAGPEAGSFLSPSSCFATESVMMMKHCSVGGRDRPNRPRWASLCMQAGGCQFLQEWFSVSAGTSSRVQPLQAEDRRSGLRQAIGCSLAMAAVCPRPAEGLAAALLVILSGVPPDTRLVASGGPKPLKGAQL